MDITPITRSSCELSFTQIWSKKLSATKCALVTLLSMVSVQKGFPLLIRLAKKIFVLFTRNFTRNWSFSYLKVEPGNLPDIKSVDMRYVYLIAKSDDGHFQFHKEVKILLSFKNGMVFIQTDKPIYTPKQKGKIYVTIAMNLRWSNCTIFVTEPLLLSDLWDFR